MTAETFKPEITAALRAYDRYVVCLEKVPEECESALSSLVEFWRSHPAQLREFRKFQKNRSARR